jgi:hypothetical protein
MPAPYEFKTRLELVRALKRKKSSRWAQFAKRGADIQILIKESIGGNTFRAFQKMPSRPSVFFREWALGKFSEVKTRSSLLRTASQSGYDSWLKAFGEDLHASWKATMGEDKDIPYGPRMKLCNLLLKRVVLWDGIPDERRRTLIGFLHVPLDQYTLAAIRNCIAGDIGRELIGKIPKRATMGFVQDEPMYLGIQQVIRGISKEAEVPPIFLDLLAWDGQH